MYCKAVCYGGKGVTRHISLSEGSSWNGFSPPWDITWTLEPCTHAPYQSFTMISNNRFIFLAAFKEQASKMPLLFSRSAPIILSDGIAYNVSTERSDRDKAAPKPSSTPGQYGPVRPKSHNLSKARSLSSDFVDKAAY